MNDTDRSNERLALWGGVECTKNRVGDQYFDQLDRSGHEERASDLDLFAALGVQALRHPVLWTRVCPERPDAPDWRRSDASLGRLRELGIAPIVGLVHHGSGPRYTDLLDPEFPTKLAAYARSVAERYPWVEMYTPVNEPLTTARFSALYGHWYPHARDEQKFAQALLHQVRGVALAMQEIRRVNPRARLVQTDDLGMAHATPPLRDEATFQNERRWLAWDLLCGRFAPDHAMRSHFLRHGVPEAELQWFVDHPCPPDIVGINYYVTGERFLDHRLERYPASTHGGITRDRYADVEAVRVRAAGLAGPEALLMETWERYGLPIAITEAHLGCTREEQLRWLVAMWNAARAAKDRGADVRAVTVWALLGSYGWCHLVCNDCGHYEPGPFDMRAPQPRPTALAAVTRQLGRGEAPDHPVLQAPGWWERPVRLIYPAEGDAPASTPKPRPTARPLLITGATGTLGRAFARLCELRGLPHRLVTRQEMDLARPASIAAMLAGADPWAVINTAGFVRVDEAETQAAACARDNTEAAANLAAACAARGIRLVTFSSDMVFDGTKTTPYVERDAPRPLNMYGRSKLAAEQAVLAALPEALVIRTSSFFGPWDLHNFAVKALQALHAGRRFAAADDLVISPTYVPDLVHGSLDLLIDAESGLWHLTNGEALTWAELARRVAAVAGLPESLVDAVPHARLGMSAPRPRHAPLASERGWILPPLATALTRWRAELDPRAFRA